MCNSVVVINRFCLVIPRVQLFNGLIMLARPTVVVTVTVKAEFLLRPSHGPITVRTHDIWVIVSVV